MDTREHWFYDKKGTLVGPRTLEQLKSLWKRGEIDGLTNVWWQGEAEWRSISNIDELKTVFQKIEVEDVPSEQENKPVSSGFPGRPAPGEYRHTTKEGTTYVWDFNQETWVLEDLVAAGEEPPSPDMNAEDESRKRKRGDDDDQEGEGGDGDENETEAAEDDPKKKKKKKKKKNWKKTKNNSWVYVDGLPDDVTEEEMAEVFSKCGILKKDVETEKPKIKLYRNADGIPKGDASVCYLQEASVPLAEKLLDQSLFRGKYNISVTKATFQQKGDFQKKVQTQDPRFLKVKQLQAKSELAWGAEEGLVGDIANLRIVIVTHMHKPEEWDDPEFEDQLKLEMAEELLAKKVGVPQKISPFERSPIGAVSIKFEDNAACERCIELLDGRFFGGQKLTCKYWDGVTDFRVRETDEQVKKRIDEFGKWLEEEQ